MRAVETVIGGKLVRVPLVRETPRSFVVRFNGREVKRKKTNQFIPLGERIFGTTIRGGHRFFETEETERRP